MKLLHCIFSFVFLCLRIFKYIYRRFTYLHEFRIEVITRCYKVQCYGMTEAGPAVSLSLAFAKEAEKAKSGGCGTILRNSEMKIVDPDSGVSLGRNQVGEICVRGNQIMKGACIISIPLNFHSLLRRAT